MLELGFVTLRWLDSIAAARTRPKKEKSLGSVSEAWVEGGCSQGGPGVLETVPPGPLGILCD